MSELGLLQPVGVGNAFRFRRGPKPTLPNEVFVHALLSFWQGLYPTRREFSVEAITHEPGGPGRVFLMDEESIAERLAAADDLTQGAIRWDESTGMRQVYANNLEAIDPSIFFEHVSPHVSGDCRMKTLSERVRINRRFQRSIRVDSDIDEPGALEGFVCPPSTAQSLVSMAKQIAETGQGAFTGQAVWLGKIQPCRGAGLFAWRRSARRASAGRHRR